MSVRRRLADGASDYLVIEVYLNLMYNTQINKANCKFTRNTKHAQDTWGHDTRSKGVSLQMHTLSLKRFLRVVHTQDVQLGDSDTLHRRLAFNAKEE